jgi:beta-lactamase regulating signal transducer with metallopeptidase domain
MPDTFSSLDLLHRVWEMSWQATAIVLLVLIVRAVLGRSIGSRWRHALWGLVLLRLVIPTLPASRFSLYAVADHHMATTQTPTPPVPLPAMNSDAVVGKWVVTSEPPATPPTGSPVATTAVVRPTFHRSTPNTLVMVWLLVASVLMFRLIRINRRFNASVKALAVETDERFVRLAESARRRIRIGRTPTIVVTGAVGAPAVAGVFRPRILLPLDASSIPDSRLRLVFLHELSHIKHHDVAVDWVWAIVQSIHWFNPILWLVWPLRRGDREVARDEAVLSLAGPDQAEPYGQTLIQLARPLGLPALCPGLIGLFGRKNDLQRRVTMISRFEKSRPIAAVIGLLVLTAVGCGTLTSPKQNAPAAIPSTYHPTTPGDGPTSVIGSADDSDSPTSGDKSIADKLDRPIDSVVFVSTPLETAIDKVMNPTGVNVYIDWPALERASVDRKDVVTCKLRDVKVSKALEIIFKCVEGEDENHKLGYVIDQGVVTITTRQELDKNVVIRMYDINDLLFVPPDYGDPPATTRPIAAANPKNQSVSAEFRAGEPAEDDPAIVRRDRIDEVVRYIEDNVAADSWKDNGGETGSISTSPLRAILLITQTPANQKKVAAVLDALRQPMKTQISLETRVLSFDEASFASLSEPLRMRLASTGDTGGQMLSTEDVSEMVNAMRKSPTTVSVTLPRLTSFNGQKCLLVINTQQAYVSSYSAVVEAGRTTYEPHPGTVTANGVRMKVMSSVSPDRKSVFVDIDSTLYRLLELRQEPCPTTPPSAGLMIQRPIEVTSTTRTSVAIPDGATYLLGCGTFTADLAGDTGADKVKIEAAERSKVFMLVMPKVLTVPTSSKK